MASSQSWQVLGSPGKKLAIPEYFTGACHSGRLWCCLKRPLQHLFSFVLNQGFKATQQPVYCLAVIPSIGEMALTVCSVSSMFPAGISTDLAVDTRLSCRCRAPFMRAEQVRGSLGSGLASCPGVRGKALRKSGASEATQPRGGQEHGAWNWPTWAGVPGPPPDLGKLLTCSVPIFSRAK